jgi:hypothetical protein
MSIPKSLKQTLLPVHFLTSLKLKKTRWRKDFPWYFTPPTHCSQLELMIGLTTSRDNPIVLEMVIVYCESV